jgi:anthranilate/para-aminobenzoate synthase component I
MAVTTERITRLVPVVRERLADLETPVSAFAKLRPLGGAFLLESAEGGERMGRYSFIGISPREVLAFTPDEDPLATLRATLARYRREPVAGLPRFSGGAVGFESYEAVRRFERLPLAANDPYEKINIMSGRFLFNIVQKKEHSIYVLLILNSPNNHMFSFFTTNNTFIRNMFLFKWYTS